MKEINKHLEMYGFVTVGERGQVVIPSKARHKLGIKAGDKLLVLGAKLKGISLIKASELTKIVSKLTDRLSFPEEAIAKTKSKDEK